MVTAGEGHRAPAGQDLLEPSSDIGEPRMTLTARHDQHGLTEELKILAVKPDLSGRCVVLHPGARHRRPG